MIINKLKSGYRVLNKLKINWSEPVAEILTKVKSEPVSLILTCVHE